MELASLLERVIAWQEILFQKYEIFLPARGEELEPLPEVSCMWK
jgi:hypothetical protein